MEPNSRDEERLGASIIKNLYTAKQERKYNRVRSITRRGREGRGNLQQRCSDGPPAAAEGGRKVAGEDEREERPRKSPNGGGLRTAVAIRWRRRKEIIDEGIIVRTFL